MKNLNMNKIKVWIEIGLALLLVIVIGIAANKGAFDKNNTRASSQDVLKKAEAENEAAKAGKSGDLEDSKKSDNSGKTDKAGKSDKTGKADKAEKTDENGKIEENGKTNENKSTEKTVEEVIAKGQYPIMGKSSVSVNQMVEYFNSSGEKYPKEALEKGGADSIESFCQMYYDEAVAEGVRPEVAFVQTMKETGWLQYGGDAAIKQFNFAGLGTTGGGVPGNSYPDVRTGIRAQIQHLKAYATPDALSQACVDDRYEYVTKGCAPYVEWLGQQENPKGFGWATADNYGYSIVDMISNLKKMK